MKWLGKWAGWNLDRDALWSYVHRRAFTTQSGYDMLLAFERIRRLLEKEASGAASKRTASSKSVAGSSHGKRPKKKVGSRSKKNGKPKQGGKAPKRSGKAVPVAGKAPKVAQREQDSSDEEEILRQQSRKRKQVVADSSEEDGGDSDDGEPSDEYDQEAMWGEPHDQPFYDYQDVD